MQVSETKARLREIEPLLSSEIWVTFATFYVGGKPLHVAITDRLRKRTKRERLWQSREMLVTLKNAAYGFHEENARSVGGRDGIFLVDRDYKPRNAMMTKLFDQFLDKADSGAEEIAARLNMRIEDLLPVRLVSHHMRLLGVLSRTPDCDYLVLVDFDRTK